MSCSRGKANPDAATKLRLFTDSAGYCQNPKCNNPLFHDFEVNKNVHVGEMAHIFSASDTGPRADRSLTKEERGNYNNLILLCSNCHTLVDKSEEDFPHELIKQWKESHKKKIEQLFQIPKFGTRPEARAFIEKFLEANKFIFETYGPMTDERFNPESEMPKKWKAKILEEIIPNNRKILMCLEINRHLFNGNENRVYVEFSQHVSDFEAKHIGVSEASGIQFPKQMNDIFR